ncbi:orotidine-5'-phosphate decarboxylase [Alteromonadaceae bacterium M269]|nr:orotidine-5'-phosphate decarboxylase [Alteromonadaceae bacterium M269]
MEPRVIIALDFDNEKAAKNLIEQLEPSQCRLKIGKEMFTYLGPGFVKWVVSKGFDVFLDLKFHDIPNTTAKACVAAANLGVWMVNVHASGGLTMMETARAALDNWGTKPPKLIGVTVLTSMDMTGLGQIGISVEPATQVLNLAKLTQQAGLDGVVCSAQEAVLLREHMPSEFNLVTPGIRPIGSDMNDQKRVMTPPQAIEAGVDYLVIGRPITQSATPLETLKAINNSLAIS